jgi:hypothetical protein
VRGKLDWIASHVNEALITANSSSAKAAQANSLPFSPSAFFTAVAAARRTAGAENRTAAGAGLAVAGAGLGAARLCARWRFGRWAAAGASAGVLVTTGAGLGRGLAWCTGRCLVVGAGV